MILAALLPLMLFLIATAIALGTDAKTLDGIPAPLAAITGVLCLIWFVAVSPCLIKIVLVVSVLVFGKVYLQDILKLR